MDPRYQELGTENELAVVLSHYSSNFVYDIVHTQIESIMAGSAISAINPPPNVVGAWEQNFKAIIDQYGAEGMTQIQEVRIETYREIIDIICQSFNLNFTVADVDLFSAAYTLYDFFVCHLPTNIITFFSKYIYKERAAIYDSMALYEMKKNKDSSTIYGKRMYKDIKLAVINANILKIITNLSGMDFDFQSIINTIIDDKNTARYILNLISDKGDFFHDIIMNTMNANLAEYVTGIRLNIQELAISHDQIVYTAAPDQEDQEVPEE